MKIDIEKNLGIANSFDEIVELSKSCLDNYSINNLRNYFDNLLAVEDEADLKEIVKLSDIINRLSIIIPKRIDRLLELNAPQVVIDQEVLALEAIKKLTTFLDK